jgi:hypothetical protein
LVARKAITAAARSRTVPIRKARSKPAVKAKGAAELHRSVEQGGRNPGLVRGDAFGGGGGDAGEDAAGTDRDDDDAREQVVQDRASL